MNQWEVWTFNFPDAGPHPAIIVSHPDRAANAPALNVLICTSQRATRPPKKNEILLDEADGFDWPTLCRCDLLYLVDKNALNQRRGAVTVERRRAIVRSIWSNLGFTQV